MLLNSALLRGAGSAMSFATSASADDHTQPVTNDNAATSKGLDAVHSGRAGQFSRDSPGARL